MARVDPSDVVWAKVRYCSFWPAQLIANPPEEIKENGKPGQVCVFFFGSKEFAFVENGNIKSYCENYHTYSKRCKRKKFLYAVEQCDKFLTDPETYFLNAFTEPTEDTVTVQTALNFPIKEEPVDDEPFHVTKTVLLRQQEEVHNSVPHNDFEMEETGDRNYREEANISEHTDFKSHLMALENIYKKQSEQINQFLNEKNTTDNGKNYDLLLAQKNSEIQELQKKNSDYAINVNRFKANSDSEIAKMKKELEEKNIEISNLFIEKQTAQNSILDLETKDQNHNSLLSQKNSEIEALEKKNSCYAINVNRFKANSDSEIAKLKKELEVKNIEINNLTIKNQTAQNSILDLETKDQNHNSLLAQKTSEIKALENNLKEKNTEINNLTIEKQTAQNAILDLETKDQKHNSLLAQKNSEIETLEKKNACYAKNLNRFKANSDSEIAKLKKELEEKNIEINNSTIEKQTAQNSIRDLRKQHENEMVSSNEVLRKKNNECDSLLTEIEALKAKVANHEETLKQYHEQITDLENPSKRNTNRITKLILEKQTAEGSDPMKKKLEEKDLQLVASQKYKMKDEYNDKAENLKKQTKKKKAKSATNAVGTSSNRKRKRERVRASTSKGPESSASSSKKEKTESELEVEKLVNHKEENGSRYFLVRWKGYRSSSNTWVRESQLNYSVKADMLEKYKRKNNLN